MGKSFFGKYMFAFGAIIVVSFVLLAAIIGSLFSDYAVDSIRTDVNNSVSAASNVVENYYRQSTDSETFPDFVRNNSDRLRAILSGFSGRVNDNMLLLTDQEGQIIMAIHANEKVLPLKEVKAFPKEVLTELTNGEIYEGDGLIGGLFTERHIIGGLPILNSDGAICGAVFSCSSVANEAALILVMNRMIIMACMLVMLAAMIAVYMISDRISDPLRSMTAAAKEYGKGKLDTRVEIHGQDEIAELAVAFNNMADSLEETEKMRNSFLANVSHDLRTPMTTIAGFVDGMISGAIPKEKQPEYLEIVSSEVHRLSRLVSEILDVSRLESGERKFTETRFDVCETARLILISFEQKINEKKLEVEFSCEEDSLFAVGDQDAVHQVLYNLVDNALKFSREGGILRISLQVKNPGTLEVAVYNQGQGIPTEDLPYVFERFYKSDKSRGLDKTGVGLGLYIVKTILEAMKQTISVESVYGEFCEFRFTLKQDVSGAGTPAQPK